MKNSTFQKEVFTLTFSLIAPTFITCCKDKPDEPSDPVLPPLTNEGKNTFGCYIDGQLYVPKMNYTIGGAAVSGAFNESTKYFLLQASHEHPDEKIESVSIQVYVLTGEGNYVMHANTLNYEGYNYYGNTSACIYYHDMNNKGTVNITFLDTEKNIISGTFSMTLINPNCSTKKTMVITDGRFDFGY